MKFVFEKPSPIPKRVNPKQRKKKGNYNKLLIMAPIDITQKAIINVRTFERFDEPFYFSDCLKGCHSGEAEDKFIRQSHKHGKKRQDAPYF